MITVGVADMAVTADPEETLVTYALGSCAGVCIYDPEVRVAGMLHAMLPLSKMDRGKAERSPLMFVDTGVPELFRQAYDLGARKERVIITVAGCGRILDDDNHFRIGERNHATLRRMLWKNGLFLAAEDVGESKSRTMYCRIGDGRVTVRVGRDIKELHDGIQHPGGRRFPRDAGHAAADAVAQRA